MVEFLQGKKMFFVLFAILVSCAQIKADSLYEGKCAKVDPMIDFDIHKFLGEWHVIQETVPFSKCKSINFTAAEQFGEFKIIEKTDFDLECKKDDLWDGKFITKYSGRLTFSNTGPASRMSVKFPISPLGSGHYVVFDTDYENYAGIYMCNSLFISHIENVLILSKNRTLDASYVNKLREKLDTFDVDISDLQDMEQTECLNKETSPIISIHMKSFRKAYWLKKIFKTGIEILLQKLKLSTPNASSLLKNGKKASKCFVKFAKHKVKDLYALAKRLIRGGVDSLIDNVDPLFDKAVSALEALG